MTRSLRNLLVWLGLVAIVAVAITAAVLTGSSGPSNMAITVDFPSAPGLYSGDHVEILGVQVGTVTSVKVDDAGAVVTLSVRSNVSLPQTVRAEVIAPQLISERQVALTPAYEGGPRLESGDTIPATRTAVSLSIDQILQTVDQLVAALGPKGLNANGAAANFLNSFAKEFNGAGPGVHDTITALGQGLGALGANSQQLTALLDAFGTLTKAASSNLSVYSTFAGEMQAVSANLASNDSDIGQALATLQQALADLGTFLAHNSATLGGSFANVEAFAKAVASQEGSLAKVFGVLPVAVQNVSMAYDPTAPGGGGFRARFDPTTGAAAFTSAVCGSALTKLLSVALATPSNPDPKANEDFICGLAGVGAELPAPPGASAGPNLSLQALLGGQP